MNISLKYKFLIPAVLIFILGMATVTVVSHIRARQALETVIIDEIDHITQTTVNTMSAWLNDRRLDLVNWSRQGGYRKALINSFLGLTARSFANEQLRRIKSDYGYYKSLLLADLSGDIVAASEPDRIGRVNISDQMYFQTAQAGGIHVTKTALKSSFDNELIVVISAPVKENGTVTGVLCAVFDLTVLAGRFIDQIRVGQGGFVYIFLDDGYIVCSSDCAGFSGRNIHEFDFGKTMSQKRRGILEYRLDSRIGMTAAFRQIESLGWTVVVSAVKDEILMPVKTLGRINAAVSSIVLFIVAVVIFLITLTISRPIQEVLEGLKQMGEGDFSFRIDVQNKDEIGQIGHALNRMARNLEASEQKIKEQNNQLIRARDDLELRVEQRTYALRQAEKKYRGIFENAVEGIFQGTAKGYILSANPSLARILGYPSVAEMFSGNRPLLFPVSRAEGKIIIRELESRGKIVAYETQIRKKNGDLFWGSISVSQVVDEESGHIYFEGFVVDISERREKEEALREYKAAKSANRAKSEFIANMSHEIRTPLNTLLGFSELLSADLSDPRQERYIASMQVAGNSLLTLINDILDLSKIEAGQMVLKTEPVNFGTLCSEIRYIFKEKAAQKGLGLLIDLPDDFPGTVFLDETRMRQILLNLVGNAVKFTEKGQITVSVRTRPADGKAHIDLVITVRDTGPGIHPFHQGIIFESFRQIDGQTNRRHGGTGLGLAICKRLTEAMGGSIRVNSTPKQGSTFEVVLHRVRIQGGPAAGNGALAAGQRLPHRIYETAKILIVDDIEPNRLMLKELLTKYNFEVTEALDGQQAVDMVRADPPALILMDIRMPVMDGTTATQILKNDPETGHIPIVAFTGDVVAQSKGDVIRQGCDGYLSKPVNLDELNRELSRYFTVLEEPEPAEKQSDYDWDTFSKAMIRNPEQLLEMIESQVRPVAESCRGGIVINQIKTLSDQLTLLAQTHRVEPLLGFARQLRTAVDLFDITEIEKQMARLPGMLERLTDKL